jgi:hypothetical protein
VNGRRHGIDLKQQSTSRIEARHRWRERAARMTLERRAGIARKAGASRWGKR